MGLTDQERLERRRAQYRRYNQSSKGLARDARRRTTVGYALAQVRHEAKRRGNR